jgi:hypothetical protein
MQNDTTDDLTDDLFDFTAFALSCAAAAKGADLDDDEIEATLDWVSWYILALAHGADPYALVAVMQAEADGTQVFN